MKDESEVDGIRRETQGRRQTTFGEGPMALTTFINRDSPDQAKNRRCSGLEHWLTATGGICTFGTWAVGTAVDTCNIHSHDTDWPSAEYSLASRWPLAAGRWRHYVSFWPHTRRRSAAEAFMPSIRSTARAFCSWPLNFLASALRTTFSDLHSRHCPSSPCFHQNSDNNTGSFALYFF